MAEYYAHSTANQDKSDWQTLPDHLANVARLAEKFADVFNAGEWGRCAGLLHDAGKATDAFTARLEGNTARVDHSTFGARLARERLGRLGLLLAYVIVGHHGGLTNGGNQEGELHFRLKHAKVPPDVALLTDFDLPKRLAPPFKLPVDRAGFSLAFFTRMIFSCLVDADFLDTEAFCDPDKAQLRPEHDSGTDFRSLQQRFTSFLQEKAHTAKPSPVNALRQSILAQCRENALLPQGFFSLTVPTGGGKTFSSLAFALDHALAHGLRRIIYAIPFTSIIEQNAREFQAAIGADCVLEHHCNYKESDEHENDAYNRRRGLATENWDAPLVVTTNVQFFESLFNNKTSRCRKLHNIAGSVIILDEAQAIPTEYLEACLAALRELVERYTCTVVLCTATQPALDDKSTLRTALPHVQEIIDDPLHLYRSLQRTEVQFIGKVCDDELAERLADERQVLCIVSTKAHARTLYEKIRQAAGEDERLFHLSTNMYPIHRRQVLNEIRAQLKVNMPCRVISTSLVEAGVDLDFPVVYRAMAGLDSIAQAAGRCNREGLLPEKGKVFVFEAEQPPRMPWIKRCAARAAETLRTLPQADPLGLETMRRYFELLYDVEDLDKKQILPLLNPKLSTDLIWPFQEAGQAFRFIEEETIGVIIPIEAQAQGLVQELRYTQYPRATLRKLQQYTVGVRSRDFAALDAAGALEMIHGEFPLLCNEATYRAAVGLCVDEGEVWNPENLCI
ncbi:CRISPR-associated helicase, Cas3 family [Geoalkalibacter ferrihydriticus]|uniref:CRISPR-associated protein Cas3 n=2 Tax=Geoalkalibacter ferrihydriticus TaxID=392333 RepID=A0A0C2DSA3_9BACT|nr:CRISPR-associated helicase/endonuclease Cas3 [Geoalkalibacter ferrihydriticus]KIH76344.1 CRISPR-associated protein Cas3 [Geoalkalibacter ferrihydriticus DSM 17813]SDL19523.1 CRISPR-associated helicase, Cas3 family [Geoalkalibacter ferrihydriticus]